LDGTSTLPANKVSITDVIVDHAIVAACECQVCVGISGNCVFSPTTPNNCVYASDKQSLTVTVAAPTVAGDNCSVGSIQLDGTSATSPIALN